MNPETQFLLPRRSPVEHYSIQEDTYLCRLVQTLCFFLVNKQREINELDNFFLTRKEIGEYPRPSRATGSSTKFHEIDEVLK